MPARPIPSVVVPDEAFPSNRTQICQVFDSAGEPVIWYSAQVSQCVFLSQNFVSAQS